MEAAGQVGSGGGSHGAEPQDDGVKVTGHGCILWKMGISGKLWGLICVSLSAGCRWRRIVP
jgi:hypothetical protein